MSESKVLTLFKESTDMYCQGNYQACLALLSDCLTLQCDRSILYSNRAIANFHLKQLQDSFQDLEKAISKNHLNYVAYFNLFSLHFLNQNNAQAFKNLCLCLSSAYTVLCKFNPLIQWVDKSIYYGFNNKQSLLIKAILIYQKSQLRASLQLLQQVMEYQVSKKNKEGVAKHIELLQTQLGLPASYYSCCSTQNQQYILKTDISLPEQNLFQEELTRLLKQFNQVYRLINQQMQMEHQFKAQVSNSSAHQQSQILDEKQISQTATAVNSIAFSRTVQPDQHNYNQKQLKLLSFIGNNKSIATETQSEKNIFALGRSDPIIKLYIDEADLDSLDKQGYKLDNLYAILSYHQYDKIFEHRTSIIKKKDSCIKWNELTIQLRLSSEQSELKIKILQKKYTSFKDDLIGEASIMLNKYGPLSIPIKKECQAIGILKMRVDWVE